MLTNFVKFATGGAACLERLRLRNTTGELSLLAENGGGGAGHGWHVLPDGVHADKLVTIQGSVSSAH